MSMHLVVHFGRVYRMKTEKFRRYLEAGIESDGAAGPEDVQAELIGRVDLAATDATKDDFKMALEALELQQKHAPSRSHTTFIRREGAPIHYRTPTRAGIVASACGVDPYRGNVNSTDKVGEITCHGCLAILLKGRSAACTCTDKTTLYHLLGCKENGR